MTLPVLADLLRQQTAGHAELRALLADVLVRLARIEAAQRVETLGARLSDDDALALRDLLPTLYTRWPARIFTASEVAALIQSDAKVREALHPITAGKKAAANCVGWFLRRVEGTDVGGHVLRVHGDSSPRLYSVQVLNPGETGETLFRA